MLGGLFIAAWSTYAFETAICYTSEFKNPATDTFNAIFYSGLLCIVVFTLVPFTFQGFLGRDRDDCAGRRRWNRRRGGHGRHGGWRRLQSQGLLVLLMVLALLLSTMTAMAGSSRTLYQGSVDGWLPRYLSHVNSHGAPTGAMWTGLVVQSRAADVHGVRHCQLLLRAGDLQLRLHHLQLPQSQRRLDSSHRQRPHRAARGRRRRWCSPPARCSRS